MKSLQEFKTIINKEIERQFTELETFADTVDPLFGEMATMMKNFIGSGGKRFRPYLAYLAYVGAGGKNENTIVPVAASLELLHSFLLIHDDIIDQDYVRYGVKNIDGRYQERFASLGKRESRRQGGSMAILAGDVAHILSSQAIARSDISAATRSKVLERIFETTMKVAGGELVDVLISMGLKDIHVTEERVLRMYAHKTASYTFELPFRVGCIVATNEDKYVDAIKDFSTALGIAYQITDDLIGVFGDSAETGKSNDGDIKEGKRTILYCKALDTLPIDARKRFNALYGHRQATDAEIAEVKMILEKHGVRQIVEKQRDAYNEEAERHFKTLPFSQEAKKTLWSIYEKLKNRTS